MKITILLTFCMFIQFLHAQQVTLTLVASGLTYPVDIKNAGDRRMFIVQQNGRIRLIDTAGVMQTLPFLDISNRLLFDFGERGLLGLAFDPDYSNNGRFYVNYSRPTDGATRISRFHVTSNPNHCDSTTEQVLLTISQPYTNHKGGGMAFGSDGYLYLSLGDGGSGGDPGNRAQNKDSLLGKILRIDVRDTSVTYRIPADNPFVDTTGRDEIWAFGLRNPWRISFDRLTSELWISDVGQSTNEELNFEPANSKGGFNYGWRCYEGNAVFNTSGCGTISNYKFPVYEYNHTGGNCTIIGGYRYRGGQYSNLWGKYIYGDYCGALIRYLTETSPGVYSNTTSGASLSDITTFGEDMYGELYVGTIGGQAIYKISDTLCKPVSRITDHDTILVCDSTVLHAVAGYQLSYTWLLNGNVIPGANSVNNVARASGVYKVITKNPGNCSDTSNSIFVTINKPVAGYTVNNPTQCFNSNSFMFIDTSQISSGTLSRIWSFGDSTTSISINPLKVYTSVNTFSVKLVSTSNIGCKDSITKTITVNPKPNVGFTINNTIQCLNGNNFLFMDTSLISNGSLTRMWNFGDNTTSSSINPTKVYSTANNFSVSLVSTSNNGCKDSITKTMTVSPKPNPGFTINIPAQCLASNNFIFSDTSTVSTGSITRVWNFGDTTTSSVANPSKIYNSVNTYMVKLVSTSDKFCKDSLTKTVTINPPPTATSSAGGSTIFCQGGSVSLIANTGTGLTYQWRNNNLNISGATSSVYVASTLGNYKVVVTNTNSCMDSSSVISVIVNPLPVSGFTTSNTIQCLKGNSFLFDDTSTISSGILVRSWSFGDGGVSNLINPVKSYFSPSIFTVKLISVSNYGCKDSISKMVTVNSQPGANITTTRGTGLFCINDSITLKANTGASNTYTWLENGTVVPMANQNKLNTKLSAVYQVIVSNNKLCTDTSLAFITTEIPLPVVGNITGPLSVTSIVNPVTYSINPQAGHLYYWTLIGGNILSGQGTNSINVKWVLTGARRIRVKLINTNNCADTSAINVTVTTNISEQSGDNTIEIYPNPMDNRFNISSSKLNMNSINIYNSQGRLVKSMELKEKEASVDAVELSVGIFIVEVKTDNGLKYFKVVKN
ncbi:MAG: PQQ-dependent sugar dehydrogenase [Bacteroidota bacterium]|nr:PQQ-dependent sugar dehydrogenase [Bacteroidota bacterium]